MIILDGTEVKVEHFPDGTQRIVLENLPDMEWRNTHEITWKFEREEELSTLIYITRHLRKYAMYTGNLAQSVISSKCKNGSYS